MWNCIWWRFSGQIHLWFINSLEFCPVVQWKIQMSLVNNIEIIHHILGITETKDSCQSTLTKCPIKSRLWKNLFHQVEAHQMLKSFKNQIQSFSLMMRKVILHPDFHMKMNPAPFSSKTKKVDIQLPEICIWQHWSWTKSDLSKKECTNVDHPTLNRHLSSFTLRMVSGRDGSWSKFTWIERECDFTLHHLSETKNPGMAISSIFRDVEWKIAKVLSDC